LKLMAGVYDAAQVVKMPSKALASEALQIERQEIEKANLAARRTDWDSE